MDEKEGGGERGLARAGDAGEEGKLI